VNSLTESLIAELRAAPAPVQRRVFDYLLFLKNREDLLPLAETAWAQDWGAAEEDEASSSLETAGPGPDEPAAQE